MAISQYPVWKTASGSTWASNSTSLTYYNEWYEDEYSYKKNRPTRRRVVEEVDRGHYVERHWSDGHVEAVSKDLSAAYYPKPAPAPAKKSPLDWLRGENEAVCRLARAS